jgi:hypothetical protein
MKMEVEEPRNAKDSQPPPEIRRQIQNTLSPRALGRSVALLTL